jgi:hypothetical protein
MNIPREIIGQAIKYTSRARSDGRIRPTDQWQKHYSMKYIQAQKMTNTLCGHCGAAFEQAVSVHDAEKGRVHSICKRQLNTARLHA